MTLLIPYSFYKKGYFENQYFMLPNCAQSYKNLTIPILFVGEIKRFFFRLYFSNSIKMFYPMIKNCLKASLIVFMMLSYINRGLFVDMSEADFSYSIYIPQTTNEINSVLELVLKLTGYGENDIDEDGDMPENYASFQFSKLLVCQHFTQIINNLFSNGIKKSFCVFSDMYYSQPYYGQIDHPPES